MKRDYNISVAMATYNGAKYIREQLESILKQLNEKDEIIISDDGSIDNTIDIINSLKDERIKILNGPKKGVKQNFANAISNCSGKYIFLSDQDDVWINGKVDTVLNTFDSKKCKCVVHDCIVFDSQSNDILHDSFYKFRKSRNGIIKNIFKNSYIGCCMAFDSELIKLILPIPNDIEMHDQWIGIIAEKKGKSIFITDKLIKYRRHNNNASQLKHHSLFLMITNRIRLIKRLIKG